MSPKDHSEYKRGFYHISKSIYAGGKTWKNGEFDELIIGFYLPDGSTTGEFSITWRILGGEAVPQLRVFGSAWGALLGFQDMLEKLAEHSGEWLHTEAVIALLKECGIEDLTDYGEPDTE